MTLRPEYTLKDISNHSVKFLLQSFDGPTIGLLESLSMKAFIIQVPQINSIFINVSFWMNVTPYAWKNVCINDIAGYETRLWPFPHPYPAPCLYSQLGFQDAREMGERGAEECEASLQMASLTERAVFHSLPKNSQDLGPFEQPKPPAKRSSRPDDWMNELLKRKKINNNKKSQTPWSYKWAFLHSAKIVTLILRAKLITQIVCQTSRLNVALD